MENNDQNIWRMENTAGQADERGRKRHFGLGSVIAIALICSLLGGGLSLAVYNMFPARYPLKNVNNIINNKTDNRGPTSNTKQLDINIDAYSSVADVAEKVGPAVVGIKAYPPTINQTDLGSIFGNFFGSSQAPNEGSGIIISEDGYIVTNSHVIEKAMNQYGKVDDRAKIEIYLPGMVDKPQTAKFVGWDRKTDLAVLKIDMIDLPAIEFADSGLIRIGEPVVAIGNPGGLEYMGSVTVGVISGLNRTVGTEDGKNLTYIQTDAAINPGNSGGALVNSKGGLVGINTVKVVATGFEGLGFAIPSNTVRQIVDELINYSYVRGRPYLGIYYEPDYTESVAKRYNLPVGVYVSEVVLMSGAYNAGIKKNDIIVSFEDKPVKTINDLTKLIAEHKPDDKVIVTIYRDKENIDIEVILGEEKG